MKEIDENLSFIKEKIKEIKIALFKSELNSVLQLPNNVIETFRVDDDGTIWFFTSCNNNYAKNIDRSFYASLNYYKKGNGCRLILSGKADIVKEEDMNENIEATRGIALVKMKIMQAEYFDNKQPANASWTDKIKETFNQLFFAPSHRVYDFS